MRTILLLYVLFPLLLAPPPLSERGPLLLLGRWGLLDFEGHLGVKLLGLPKTWHILPSAGQVWPAGCCERPHAPQEGVSDDECRPIFLD